MRLAVNEIIDVCIDAKQLYGGTPVIEVNEGEIYSFKAGQGRTWIDSFVPSTAKGFLNPLLLKRHKRVKEAKCFELCGTIGEGPGDNFRIGMQRLNFRIPCSGDLRFFPNDHPEYYHNNKGCMLVNVKRES